MSILSAYALLSMAENAWSRRDLAGTANHLDSFWKAKAEAWSSDPAVQQKLTAMDAEAHSIWARMEDLKAFRAGTDSQERIRHAQTAAQAWKKAAILKAQAGGPEATIKTYERLSSASAASPEILNKTVVDTRYSSAFKAEAGEVVGSIFKADLLGVPVWAWAAGGALLVVAIATR